MMFRLASLVAILSTAMTTVDAAAGVYNYDETHVWDQVEPLATNECGGSKNSPIAVDDMACTDYHNYVMVDGTCTFAHMKAKVTNNGVWLGIDSEAKCEAPYFILPGTTDKYTFAQLHVHLSSEHTIDGKYYAAELHMVHVGPKRYSVVGTMIMPNKPDDNQAFGPYIDSWKDARFAMESTCPADASCKVKNKYATGNNLLYPGANKMKPYDLVETGSFFSYFGGLTTPPCTQAVYWNLADKPMNISPRQFAVMSEIILKTLNPAKDCKEVLTVASKSGSTSRPPQLLNGRTVKKICPVGKTGESGTGNTNSTTTDAASTIATAYTVGALSFSAAMAAGQFL